MRLADYVIKFLESKEIDTVFTLSGGGSIFLCDALYKAKKLKWFGYDRENSKDKFGNWIKPQEEMDIPEGDVGYKFNMNNIAAAIGLSQVPKIEEIISKHINNGQRYNKHFHNHKKIFPIKIFNRTRFRRRGTSCL